MIFTLRNDTTWKRPKIGTICELCRYKNMDTTCDYCPRRYHRYCVGLVMERNAEGKWMCAHCVKHGIEIIHDDVIEHENKCFLCKEYGELICCDTCTLVYHMECLNNELEDIPEKPWKCPKCLLPPLYYKAEKIISWRWDNTDKPKMKRDFYVKWIDKSYWHCYWVPQLQLEVHYPAMLNSYQKCKRMINPIMYNTDAFDDVVGGKLPLDYNENDKKLIEEHNGYKKDLKELYYMYGVKPKWLKVQRIVDHKHVDFGILYLVKWCGLEYKDNTWETIFIPGVSDNIENYWNIFDICMQKLSLKFVCSSKVDAMELKKSQSKDNALKRYTLLPSQPIVTSDNYELNVEYLNNTSLYLKPHQIVGINWLRSCYSKDKNVILADECDVSTSIQAITFLYSLIREGRCKGPVLIVAYNISDWEDYLDTWAPGLYYVTYDGSIKSRELIRDHEFNIKNSCVKKAISLPNHKKKFDVLLTRSEWLTKDANKLDDINWSVLVLADDILRFIKISSRYKIAYKLILNHGSLTHTVGELLLILNFLCPEKFRSIPDLINEFRNKPRDRQEQRLFQFLNPIMLRRFEIDINKNAPKILGKIIMTELTVIQKKLYYGIAVKRYRNTKPNQNEPEPESESDSLHRRIMDFEKCCNHPYLFPTILNDKTINMKLKDASGKLIFLSKMLLLLRMHGHRVVIFSKMNTMLDILESFLNDEGYKYERIDNETTDQEGPINRFNQSDSEQFVLLLSMSAASVIKYMRTKISIILYDSEWSPYNDIRAFAYIYDNCRSNIVTTYRLMTRDSVEDAIGKHRQDMSAILPPVQRAPYENTFTFNESQLKDILGKSTLTFLNEYEHNVYIDFSTAAVAGILCLPDGSDESDSD